MKVHEVDYQIIGDDLQLVEVKLEPCEVVVAEYGYIYFLGYSINFET